MSDAPEIKFYVTSFNEPTSTGLAEQLNAVKEQRDEAVNNYETAVLRVHYIAEQRDRLAEALTSIMPIFNFKYLSHEEKQKVRYASEVIAVIKGGSDE